MHASSLPLHRANLERQGFTSLPAFFSAEDCAEMRRILDGLHAAAGSPPLTGWGLGIHPLFDKAPRLARLLAHPILAAVLAECLGGPARCVHSGARFSDGSSDGNIGYHHHHDWPAEEIPTRTRIDRVLFGVYVDGTGPEQGPLVVLPRSLRDPLVPPAGDLQGRHACAGEVDLSFPPGTVSIFDTALWHTARKGTGSGRRRLFGTHTQRIDDPRTHREDNGQPFTW